MVQGGSLRDIFCQKKGCKKSEHFSKSTCLHLEKNKGLTNGFTYLCTCFGSVEKAWELHEEAIKKKQESGGSIVGPLKTFTANDLEKYMSTFIEGVVLKKWAISDCEDKWMQ